MHHGAPQDDQPQRNLQSSPAISPIGLPNFPFSIFEFLFSASSNRHFAQLETTKIIYLTKVRQSPIFNPWTQPLLSLGFSSRSHSA